MNKFDEIKLDDNPFNYEKMFYNVPMNVVICLNENIAENKVFPQIKNIACYTMDCTDDWKSKQKKIINGNQCIEYNNKNMSKEEEIEYYNNLIKIVEKTLTENFDTSKLDKGQDEVIKTEKLIISFSNHKIKGII